MIRMLVAPIFCLTLAVPAQAQSPASASAPAAEAPTAQTVAAEKKPVKVPPDYKRKIVKGEVMYCTKTTLIGSRFPKLVCLDEDGLRAMLETREAQQQDLKRAQSICASAGACAGN